MPGRPLSEIQRMSNNHSSNEHEAEENEEDRMRDNPRATTHETEELEQNICDSDIVDLI